MPERKVSLPAGRQHCVVFGFVVAEEPDLVLISKNNLESPAAGKRSREGGLRNSKNTAGLRAQEHATPSICTCLSRYAPACTWRALARPLSGETKTSASETLSHFCKRQSGRAVNVSSHKEAGGGTATASGTGLARKHNLGYLKAAQHSGKEHLPLSNSSDCVQN